MPAAESSGPLLEITSVLKRFGGVTAVDGLSLSIAAGEFFALLGPSGCGKTTLLRMLAGFESPDAGEIRLDGRDISGVLPHLRPVNMMFQSYALFPHLSVRDNIAFGLRRAGLPAPEIDARVAELVALVRLDGLESRKPDQLSGGQRQRVALARSLARRPRILLLDEPLGALDKKLREQTQAELIALQRRLGLTFIIVTHDQEEAMTMADRIGVMDRGRLVQVATPRQLYEAPNSRWIAEFFGDINLFEGSATMAEGNRLRVVAGQAGALIVDRAAMVEAGRSLAIGVRPEKIRLAARGTAPAGGDNRIDATICGISYRGGMTVYDLRGPGSVVIRAMAANDSRAAADRFAIGDAVTADFSAADCIVMER